MEQLVVETNKPSRLLRLAGWLFFRYKARLNKENRVTSFAAGSSALFSTAAMAVAVLGMPTGMGTLADMLLFLSGNLMLMGLLVFILSILLACMYVPLPNRLTAAWLYTAGQGVIILHFTEIGLFFAILFGLLYACASVGGGLLIGAVLHMKRSPLWKASTGILVALAVTFVSQLSNWPAPLAPPVRSLPASTETGDQTAGVEMASLDNPAELGPFEVETFYYGSGKDKHRDQFGEEVHVLTEPVDASAYITHWPKLKTLFWGFDQRDLPINGTVWMPVGEGPFPLVLIVHGNHLMEYFSDGGYAYLGELLASRGMIAVSVDANFMNYSVWSSLPNDDMKMRGWLLLKHLQQIQRLDEAAVGTSPFAGKVDFEKVALIGHSRGGQAVSIAADADRWFRDDQTLDSLDEVNIQSVIAIAPTDKRVDDQSARLKDINYFTIQGAMDADVNNFFGDRQYNRVSFTENSKAFKAALYIAHANHSQFNTAWGSSDERLPGGLFLNKEGLMDAEEQRLIAKVYISAFLEATLMGQSEYKALFQDYRSGLHWLPASTGYVSRYDEASIWKAASFEASNGLAASTSMDGMKSGEKETAKDRDGNSKGTSGMALEWEKPGASYELELSSGAARRLKSLGEGSFVFSMSNLEWELGASEPLPPLPEAELSLVLESGEKRVLKLSSFMAAQEPAYTSFLTMGFLEHRMKNNKYKNPVEAVFQTYIIPLQMFKPASDADSDHNGLSGLQPDLIKRIEFRFLSERGKVMLDDIGFLPEGGAYVNYRK
ncbi:alpha/beta hydrolase [Paenibacillus nanensis]|uniref:Alpha/beta hydrolase n=1 Tax=Paenibacillus nanensis TaxID=393251 RepID=A0A3A1V309_9BACL|nr:alpha/beta hydrolase [Paenibacillus nanensis]RIX54146.1 alpha/beta hydrolase [Paenibacillus nanensis]